MMDDIRIAAVIFNSPVNHIQHNLDRMAKQVQTAKKQGAAIICFPEMNISGYSIRDNIKDSAQPVPGPISQTILELAVDYQMVILAGLAEKDENGHVFASHLIVAPNGITGTYRKVHIAPPERNVLSAGTNISVFDVFGIKFGIQLCYDAHFPELSTRMAADGAEVIFMPHASPKGTPDEKFASWMRHLPARAFDNSLFVVACNQMGDNHVGLRFPGIAVVINPSGHIIAKDVSGQEGMLLADLKASDLSEVRNHKMRYFFPNRRSDLY
jgi:predicted amidohydrolase